MSRGNSLLSRGNSDSPLPRLSQWSFSVLTLPLIIYMMARELGPSAYVGVAAFIGSSLLSTLLSYAAMPFNRRVQEC